MANSCLLERKEERKVLEKDKGQLEFVEINTGISMSQKINQV